MLIQCTDVQNVPKLLRKQGHFFSRKFQKLRPWRDNFWIIVRRVSERRMSEGAFFPDGRLRNSDADCENEGRRSSIKCTRFRAGEINTLRAIYNRSGTYRVGACIVCGTRFPGGFVDRSMGFLLSVSCHTRITPDSSFSLFLSPSRYPEVSIRSALRINRARLGENRPSRSFDRWGRAI